MKTEKNLSVYLKEILQAAKYIQKYTQDITYEQFCNNRKTTQAVLMCMFIMGENANRLLNIHQDFIKETSDLKWEDMRDMGKKIVHCYFEIDMEAIWNTASQSIPQLINKISLLIEQSQNTSKP